MWKCEAFSYSTMLKPETKERGDDDAREMVHKAWLWTTGPNYRPDCELLLQIYSNLYFCIPSTSAGLGCSPGWKTHSSPGFLTGTKGLLFSLGIGNRDWMETI